MNEFRNGVGPSNSYVVILYASRGYIGNTVINVAPIFNLNDILEFYLATSKRRMPPALKISSSYIIVDNPPNPS